MPQALDQGFPPAPAYTEKNVSDLQGKVFLVTGGASGAGRALIEILYAKGAKVYVGVRTAERAQATVRQLAEAEPHSRGQLVPLAIDLSDLPSVRAAAKRVRQHETRLDVLVNNAGIMTPLAGSKSKQGYDLEMATNVLGPYLLTTLLHPLLEQTASSNSPGSVRCVWVSSMIAVATPKGGIILDESTGGPKILSNAMENYMQSKVGNVFVAKELARQGSQGVMHLSVHPGIFRSGLQRHQSGPMAWISGMLLKPARYAAYTELFAATSPSVKLDEHNGAFVIPWGRFGPIPKHIEASLARTGEANGTGTGVSARFLAWVDEQTAAYVNE